MLPAFMNNSAFGDVAAVLASSESAQADLDSYSGGNGYVSNTQAPSAANSGPGPTGTTQEGVDPSLNAEGPNPTGTGNSYTGTQAQQTDAGAYNSNGNATGSNIAAQANSAYASQVTNGAVDPLNAQVGNNGADSNDWFSLLNNSGILAQAVADGQRAINNALTPAPAPVVIAAPVVSPPTLIAGIPLSYLLIGGLALFALSE